MGVAGVRSLSFLLTHASRTVADRGPVWCDDPAGEPVSAHVGGVRDHRLAVTYSDCLHDQFWGRNGKDSRGSISRGSHRERYGPVWSNRGTGRLLHNDSCADAADVQPGRCARDVANIDQDRAGPGTKPTNVCDNRYVRGFMFLPDATRARVRFGLHARTLSLFRLRESGIDLNGRSVRDRYMVGAGILAVSIDVCGGVGKKLRFGAPQTQIWSHNSDLERYKLRSGAPPARNMVARGKCERSEHEAPGSPQVPSSTESARQTMRSCALTELSRFCIHQGLRFARPWLPYSAPAALEPTGLLCKLWACG